MMDDLEERLRSGGTPQKDGVMMTWERQCAEAADRIEALEAKLAVAREAYDDLRRYIYDKDYGRREHSIARFQDKIKELDND